MSTFSNHTFLTTGFRTRGKRPGSRILAHWLAYAERDGLVRPVFILGVGNPLVGVVEGHDSSGGKLPLSPILQGDLPTKDAADTSVGILVGMMRVLVVFFFSLVLLIRPIVVLTVVFIVIFVSATLPLAGIQAVDGLQAPAIPHCVAGARVSRAGTLKDLGVGILIVALGPWLDGVDGIVSWSVVALPPSKVVLPTPITIVIVAVAVVIALIIAAVVTAPIIASVIGAVILLVGARSPTNVFLDLLIGLVSICPLLHYHEQVLD
jgi:hypothetical protein